MTGLNAYAAISEGEGNGLGGVSLSHRACHSHASSPRPGKLVWLPSAGAPNARKTAASGAEGEARGRFARVALLCPELLPGNAQPSTH